MCDTLLTQHVPGIIFRPCDANIVGLASAYLYKYGIEHECK